MIQANSLTVQAAHRDILKDISFKLPTGAFLAIIGPNGGGKSTLVRALLGLQKHKGTVQFGTAESGAGKGSNRRVPIGYVPQIKTLDRSFPALTEELVATALKKRWPWTIDSACRTIVRDALRSVSAEHLIGEPIRNLSGGELQRVYLARAMISTPPYLFLDEPAAGVDVAGTADMLECVEQFRREHGATIVMVTHDWDVAMHHASHALVLNKEVISFGPAHDAVSEDAIRKAFGHVGHAHGVFGGGHHHD